MSDYSEKLKDVRWQKRRLEFLNKKEWRCEFCRKEDKTLHMGMYLEGSDERYEYLTQTVKT